MSIPLVPSLGALARAALAAYRRVERHQMLRIDDVVREFAIEPRGVLHLGANQGQEAEVYSRLGFKTVFWVEGHPRFFDDLVQHLEHFPGQVALQVFVSDRDGERLRFHIAENTVSSTALAPGVSFRKDFPHIEFDRIEEFSARRLDRFLSERAVDLSKCNLLVVDLEGFELKALRSLGQLLSNFDWVIAEVSVTENFIGGPMLQDIDAFLIGAGFRRVKTVLGSSSGDAVYRRAPVTARSRIGMLATSYWYSHVYYALYRDKVVRAVKRVAGEARTVQPSGGRRNDGDH